MRGAIALVMVVVACTTTSTATITALRPTTITLAISEPAAQACAAACWKQTDIAGCLSGCPGRTFQPGTCPTAETADPKVACAGLLKKVTDVRPGHCLDQTIPPGDQLLRCRDNDETSMNPTVKLLVWIGGGLLVVGYVIAVTQH